MQNEGEREGEMTSHICSISVFQREKAELFTWAPEGQHQRCRGVESPDGESKHQQYSVNRGDLSLHLALS